MLAFAAPEFGQACAPLAELAAALPLGGVARLMRANTDKLIGSAGVAGLQARGDTAASESALVKSVSCVGRRLVLGERSDEEVETVNDSMPSNSTHVSFHAYGEISPLVAGGASKLHNQALNPRQVYFFSTSRWGN